MSCTSFQSQEEKTLLASPVPFSLGLLTDHYKQNSSIHENCNFFVQVELLLIHFYQSCSDLKKEKKKHILFFPSKYFNINTILMGTCFTHDMDLQQIPIRVLELNVWIFNTFNIRVECIYKISTGKKKIKTWSGKHQSFFIWPNFLFLLSSVNEKENWSMCLYRRKFHRCYF